MQFKDWLAQNISEELKDIIPGRVMPILEQAFQDGYRAGFSTAIEAKNKIQSETDKLKIALKNQNNVGKQTSMFLCPSCNTPGIIVIGWTIAKAGVE